MRLINSKCDISYSTKIKYKFTAYGCLVGKWSRKNLRKYFIWYFRSSIFCNSGDVQIIIVTPISRNCNCRIAKLFSMRKLQIENCNAKKPYRQYDREEGTICRIFSVKQYS